MGLSNQHFEKLQLTFERHATRWIRNAGDRPPRALAHGETLSLSKHLVRWFDTPHLPECGYLYGLR